MRKMTTVRVDAEILEKAQELGLNISKACENALKLYIEALTTVNKELRCPGGDLNPQIPESIPVPLSGGNLETPFRTRDHRLTKAMPNQARPPRHCCLLRCKTDFML